MFIDLAGSTSLVVSLCESGERGIDALQNLLSSFYTALLDQVHRFGGDVYAFAGDAVLAGFTKNTSDTSETVVLRAVECAVQIRIGVRHYESIEVLGRKRNLLLKIGIGFGRYEYTLLGRPPRYTPVILGSPVQAALTAESLARGGDTIIHAEAWRHVPQPKRGTDVNGCIMLESAPSFELTTDYPRELPADQLDRRFVSRCTGLLDPGLFRKASTGHTGYSGEYREVTTMFVRFAGAAGEPSLSRMIGYMNEIHAFVCSLLPRFDAALNRVELGDKGYLFLIVLGAPVAAEAKQEKACSLALELSAPPFSYPGSVHIGIATGYAYCGDIGAPDRKDYTVTGNVVNVAARLVTYGEGAGIYIDNETRKRIEGRLSTRSIPNVDLKGIERPVTIYRLEEKTGDRCRTWPSYPARMIGRDDELARLLDIARQATAGTGRICAIAGEPGIGKSRMVGALLDHADMRQHKPLIGSCQSHRASTPYSCWQPVLRGLLGIESDDDEGTKIRKIQDSIATLAGVAPEWSPVLGEVIGLHMEEQALTRRLDPDQRNRRISQVILGLLERQAKTAPILLCFEDIHWIDEVSLRLIEYVGRRIEQRAIFMLVVSREEASFETLKTLNVFHLFAFQHLAPELARELLRERLNLRRPNTDLEDRVLEKARGNPFFIESIAISLVEQGAVVVDDDGTKRLSTDTVDIRIPFTLQDLVLIRIDQLSEDEKTVLRIGSVVGRDFSEKIVRSLIPESLSPDTVPRILGRLKARDLTPAASTEPPSYYFKHAVVRDVAYGTLSLGTRESLHRLVGEYAEKEFASSVGEGAELLAHHFVNGNVPDKGMRYSLLAARQARRKFSNQDAIYHYRHALDMLDSHPQLDNGNDRHGVMEELATVYRQAGRYNEAIAGFVECLNSSQDTDRIADLRIGLGHVYQEGGDAEQAIRELEKALRLLGLAVPRNNTTTICAIVVELIRWGLRSMGMYRSRAAGAHTIDKLSKQFDVLYLLGKIYFFGNVKKTIWAVTAAFNLAERLSLPKELSLAYANTSVALMSGGFVRKASDFRTRALDLVQDVDDPVILAQVYMRTGLIGFYTNEPKRSQEEYGAAAELFHQIGEVWEQLTAMGISTTAYAMDTNLDRAQQIFAEIEDLAGDLGSKMHLAWAKCFAPFYRYLLGRIDGREAASEIERAIPYAVDCGDFGAEILAHGHLCAIAVREDNVQESARLARITDDTLRRNKGKLPARTPQVALVYAGEAALYALEHGADGKRRLSQITARGARRAIRLGKRFPYLLGPALRLRAAGCAYSGSQREARRRFRRAIDVLERGADRWQAGLGYYEAAKWLDGNQGYFEKARSIFLEHGLSVELRRLEALSAARKTGFI